MTKIKNIFIVVLILGSLFLILYYIENKPDDVLSLYNYYEANGFNCDVEVCELSLVFEESIVTKKLNKLDRTIFISLENYKSNLESIYNFDSKNLSFNVIIDNYSFSGKYYKKKFEIVNNDSYVFKEEVIKEISLLEKEIEELVLDVLNTIEYDIQESYR